MNKKHWMYLGLWAEHGGAPGLGLFSADCESGSLQLEKQLDHEISFGASYYDPKRGILYLCNEIDKIFGVQYETGRIYGYKVSPSDGSLTELFRQDTFCPNPAYLSLDPSGEYMVVANYGLDGAIGKLRRDADGNFVNELTFRESLLELFSVNPDGTIGELLDIQKHDVDLNECPRGSHLHCAVFSPSGTVLAVCDKGSGKVHLYTIDRASKTLKLLSSTTTSAPTTCPRHCVFHPTKPYFVMNHEKERDGRMILSVFRYEDDGTVEEVCSTNVLPEGHIVPPRSHYEQQGLCFSMDGKYVYTGIKEGPNAIAVLSFDETTGQLELLQHAPIKGIWPRALAIMPGGKFIVSSCLVSGDVASYAIQDDGRLAEPGSTAVLKGGASMSFCEAM